jgi:MFS family permease
MTIKNKKLEHEIVENEKIYGFIEINQTDKKKWKSNIWKVYLMQFMMGFHLISGILIPFFIMWGRLTFVQVMLLQSYFTVMILIFEIPCGAIADYLSRKLSLILGAATTALAAYIYSSYPHIVIFCIGETFWAIGGALISGTDQAFVYDTLRKLGKENEISKVMARMRSFTLLGIGLSAPIGSIIGALISLPMVMRMMCIPMMTAALIGITFKEPNNDLQKIETQKYLKIIKSGVKEIISNRTLRILALDMVIIESLIFFLIWTYQMYLENLRFEIGYFGFVSASLTMIQIILNNIAPKLEKRYSNKRKLIQIYTLIPGIGFLLMSFVTYIPGSIALILIVIGMGFSRRIIFTNGINKQIETDNRATVISTISMIASLIRAILYPLIGYLTMISLGFTFIFLGIMIIFFVVFSRIKNEYI